MKPKTRIIFIIIITFILLLATASTAFATSLPSVSLDGGRGNLDVLQIVFMLSLVALLPTILIMMTSFTRIIIVLSFVRNALGLQQTPPNQVLIGLALLLSFFVMTPVIDDIKTQAYDPYLRGSISQDVALEKASLPLRTFMLKQTSNDDLKLFISLSKDQAVKTVDDVKTSVVIAAFVTSEMKRAFIIGFMIYIPFLIIDMVVASVLMSMGMMMLPPVMISLPFKILLFVLVDGWGLIVKTLIMSFN